MTADQKRRTIARWVVAGLPYRSWTAAETTYVLYEEMVDHLYENGPSEKPPYRSLREFLTKAKDTSRLGALDREIMGQTGGVQVQETPQLRGR